MGCLQRRLVRMAGLVAFQASGDSACVTGSILILGYGLTRSYRAQ